MDEVLYYKAYVEELLAENEKLKKEKELFQFRLEDVFSDMKENLWTLRRKIDEQISDVIEVLEDME